MPGKLIAALRTVVENNTTILLALAIFTLTLLVRFGAVDCIASPCQPQTHGRLIDLISLGQQALLCCGVLTLLILPVFRDMGGLGAGIGTCVRMALGAVFGYYFPLLVMLGTQLFDIRFVYPYLVLSSLLGMLIFLSTQLYPAVKIVLVIAFNLFLIPGANVVNADVYRYAFEGKTDLSHSGGYYAFLYSQIWIYLTRLIVFATAYVVIDTELLGRTYVLVKEIQQAIAPYRSRHQAHPESVVVHHRTPALLSVFSTSDSEHTPRRAAEVTAPELSKDLELPNDSSSEFAETEPSTFADRPSFPYPLSLVGRGQVPVDHVAFGGYAFHPLQFRVLQLLPQNIPAKKLETDHAFRTLRSRYYPNRTVSSPVILMEVYAGLRRYEPHLLSLRAGGQIVPAQTRTARKLLIDWLIRMEISHTDSYRFSISDGHFYSNK